MILKWQNTVYQDLQKMFLPIRLTHYNVVTVFNLVLDRVYVYAPYCLHQQEYQRVSNWKARASHTCVCDSPRSDSQPLRVDYDSTLMIVTTKCVTCLAAAQHVAATLVYVTYHAVTVSHLGWTMTIRLWLLLHLITKSDDLPSKLYVAVTIVCNTTTTLRRCFFDQFRFYAYDCTLCDYQM